MLLNNLRGLLGLLSSNDAVCRSWFAKRCCQELGTTVLSRSLGSCSWHETGVVATSDRHDSMPAFQELVVLPGNLHRTHAQLHHWPFDNEIAWSYFEPLLAIDVSSLFHTTRGSRLIAHRWQIVVVWHLVVALEQKPSLALRRHGSRSSIRADLVGILVQQAIALME